MEDTIYYDCLTKLRDRALPERRRVIFEWIKTGHISLQVFVKLTNEGVLTKLYYG